MISRQQKKKLPFFVLLGLLVMGMTATAHANDNYVGNAKCLECHDDMTKTFSTNIHARLRTFEGKTIMVGNECESCHGPGQKHIEEGDAASIFSFKGIGADQSSQACLKCHNTMKGNDWNLSDHALNEVSCTACHSIHTPDKTKQNEQALCMNCHTDIRTKSHYPSHHPVKEGKMKCSSCHQHHGSLVNNMKTNERMNDLCLSCHADKRGPFVFEHAPVAEDCMTCHDPHGTVANNLLKQNEPFLCLQCHESHFHAGRLGSTEARTLPATGWVSENPHGTEGWRRAFLTKCTQCHFKIHGSDHPSQSTSGAGKALTR